MAKPEIGLYRHDVEPTSMEVERQRIREHNGPTISSAAAELLARPLRFGSPVGETVKLTDLWINQASPKPGVIMRLRSTDQLNYQGTFRSLLTIEDPAIATRLAWYDFTFHREAGYPGIRIGSSLVVNLGHEGNGLGTALFHLGSSVISKTIRDLRDQDFHPHFAPWPFYWIVQDMAQTAADLLGDFERRDVARDRKKWTTNLANDCGQFIKDPQEIQRRLGFYPPHFNVEKQFLAIFP